MHFKVGFINNIEAVFVTELVENRGVGIVGGSDAVDIVLFHQHKILFHLFHRGIISCIGVAVMAVYTTEFYSLTVDFHNAVFDIYVPEACLFADYFGIGFNDEIVKIRCFR